MLSVLPRYWVTCWTFRVGSNHRPHSCQVTGVRCTGGRGSPVMSWILLKANNAQQASGVGDKRFFRFKRNVQHLWTAIIRHHVNDITHQQVMRFHNLQIFFKSIWKIPSASGHSRSPFTSCRTRQSWHNGSSLDPHVLNGYGSMILATTNTIYAQSLDTSSRCLIAFCFRFLFFVFSLSPLSIEEHLIRLCVFSLLFCPIDLSYLNKEVFFCRQWREREDKKKRKQNAIRQRDDVSSDCVSKLQLLAVISKVFSYWLLLTVGMDAPLVKELIG